MPEPEYLTVRQVADRFQKSPSWVVRRIKDGRLPAANINTPEGYRPGGIDGSYHRLVEVNYRFEVANLLRALKIDA